MGDASSQLTQRGKLLSLHQAILRRPQVLQRLRQFAGADLHAFEQAHVLDRNRGLVGKGCHQFDLFVCEGAHLYASKGDHPDCITLAQHWNGKYGPETA